MAAPASLPEFQGNVIAVQTAPFWSEELGAIADKHDKVRQMGYYLDSKHKDYANADGKMTAEQKREHLKEFEAKLISPTEKALWQRGASNARPLPRLCKDVRNDGPSLRRSYSQNDAEPQNPVTVRSRGARSTWRKKVSQ